MMKAGENHYIQPDEFSVETVLLDADLFIKYRSPKKAFSILHESIERRPNSILLREKLREICLTHKNFDEAARQCLALAGLYTSKEDFGIAYDRLEEAKSLDPRISVARALEAIRRARSSKFADINNESAADNPTETALAGNLSLFSIFDIVQIIESAQVTGLLTIKSKNGSGSVAFNSGRIVDAEANGRIGAKAFREIIEIKGGTFEFTASDEKFEVTINIVSNTKFLLDILTALDEEKAERQTAG